MIFDIQTINVGSGNYTYYMWYTTKHSYYDGTRDSRAYKIIGKGSTQLAAWQQCYDKLVSNWGGVNTFSSSVFFRTSIPILNSSLEYEIYAGAHGIDTVHYIYLSETDISNTNIYKNFFKVEYGALPGMAEVDLTADKIKFKDGSSWTSILDMLYPIGSMILWSDNNVRPAERYGGQWTLLSSDSAYKGQFLAITNGAAATGGADISSVKWTPSGKSSNVTVTPGMCNIASGTTMYAIPTYSSVHSYTHSHTFPNNAKVAKSVSIASTLTATLNFGSSGTQNYYAMAVYNKHTMDHNHQAMHGGWMATWINYHSHSFPSITAANAATAHSHTFTGSTSSINFTPAGYSLQLWRRDA